MRQTTIGILVLIVLALSAISLQADYLEKRRGERVKIPECPWCEGQEKEGDILYLPLSPRLMRLFAPADPHFLADLLWLRTTYYFGQHVLTDREYPYLFHLLDLITDLSPQWENPYLFGAVVLPTETEARADGIYLIEKGLVYHPESWKLWFFKGYYLWKSGDNTAAAEALHKASVCPEGPVYLANLSATFATQAGKKQLGLRFLQEALKRIKDPAQKRILLKKMKKLEAADDANGA